MVHGWRLVFRAGGSALVLFDEALDGLVKVLLKLNGDCGGQLSATRPVQGLHALGAGAAGASRGSISRT